MVLHTLHLHKCRQKCCEKILVKVTTSKTELVCRQGILRDLGVQWKGYMLVLCVQGKLLESLYLTVFSHLKSLVITGR